MNVLKGKSLKVFSAFTGVGSPEMALKNINCEFDVVGISEVDKSAIIAYSLIHCGGFDCADNVTVSEMLDEMKRTNIGYNFSTGKSEIPRGDINIRKLYGAHKNAKNFGDIRLVNEMSLPDFDLFTYSFPCKDISIAGGQAGLSKSSESQSSLLWECERIIKAKKPKYLLMENVKNLVGKAHIGNFEEWIGILSGMGYSSSYEILNACDFGLPQNRERTIMVSVLDESKPRLPAGVRTSLSVDSIAESHKAVEQSLFYSECRVVGNGVDGVSINGLSLFGAVDGKAHSNSRVYRSTGYSPTLNSMNGGNRQPKMHFNGVGVRRLSTLECWRLMGFSDSDHDKCKSHIPRSKMYERSGRGIAVGMLEAVFLLLGFGNV